VGSWAQWVGCQAYTLEVVGCLHRQFCDFFSFINLKFYLIYLSAGVIAATLIISGIQKSICINPTPGPGSAHHYMTHLYFMLPW